LWINQEDCDKKVLQVGMMWSVYEKARVAIIWLCLISGNDDNGPALAVVHAAPRM
jgi:hypothetical protein